MTWYYRLVGLSKLGHSGLGYGLSFLDGDADDDYPDFSSSLIFIHLVSTIDLEKSPLTLLF